MACFHLTSAGLIYLPRSWGLSHCRYSFRYYKIAIGRRWCLQVA